MLVLDLDGTTLNARGELEERDVAAAGALQQIGVQITIATGRLFTGTQWVARRLGVRGSIAVMNGSELIDADSGEVRHGRYVERSHRSTAREILGDHGLGTAFLFGSRQIHLAERDGHFGPYLETWTRSLTHHDDVFSAPAWGVADDIVAIGVVGCGEAIARARTELHEQLPDEMGSVVFRTYGGDTFLMLRHAEEDKGTALDRLAGERGCTVGECVAVGDWLNDLPMLRRAGLSLAMAQCDEAVASAADEVLDAPRHGAGAVAEVARRVWGVDV